MGFFDGDNGGMFGTGFGTGFNYQNPNTLGWLGMMSALGDAAMPSRLPVPTGAVLAKMAGGAAAGSGAYKNQLEAAQAQQAQQQAALTKTTVTAIPALLKALGGGPNGSLNQSLAPAQTTTPTLTPQADTGGGDGVASATPSGAFDTGDPDLNLVAKYESNYNPTVGWGGTDLSGTKLTANGFPDWAGKPGPNGNSTAAGLFQIEKSTWNPIADKLGIKDFSVPSQIAVANELKSQNGLSPWLPYNPRLAAAYKNGEQVQFPQAAAQGATPAGAPTQVAQGPSATATDAAPPAVNGIAPAIAPGTSPNGAQGYAWGQQNDPSRATTNTLPNPTTLTGTGRQPAPGAASASPMALLAAEIKRRQAQGQPIPAALSGPASGQPAPVVYPATAPQTAGAPQGITAQGSAADNFRQALSAALTKAPPAPGAPQGQPTDLRTALAAALTKAPPMAGAVPGTVPPIAAAAPPVDGVAPIANATQAAINAPPPPPGPGNTVTPAMLQRANAIVALSSIAHFAAPKWAEDMVEMAPGMPLSPEYKQAMSAAAARGELGLKPTRPGADFPEVVNGQLTGRATVMPTLQKFSNPDGSTYQAYVSATPAGPQVTPITGGNGNQPLTSAISPGTEQTLKDRAAANVQYGNLLAPPPTPTASPMQAPVVPGTNLGVGAGLSAPTTPLANPAPTTPASQIPLSHNPVPTFQSPEDYKRWNQTQGDTYQKGLEDTTNQLNKVYAPQSEKFKDQLALTSQITDILPELQGTMGWSADAKLKGANILT